MSYYTEREVAQKKLKCICACLSRQALADLLDMARRWGGDEVMDLYDLACGPQDYCALPQGPSIPGMPLPVPGIPGATPSPGCPGGDCGSSTPGNPQYPSGVQDQPGLPPAMTSKDRPPAWFCSPATGAIVKHLNTVAGTASVPGLLFGQGLNFPYKIWEAACSGAVPWTTVKWAFCEAIKGAAKLGMLTPAMPGMVVLLGATKALCPENATQGGSPTEQNQIKSLVGGKQQDPTKLLEKVLNPAALPHVSTALGTLLNAQPTITGNPAVDMLTAIVASGKESVLTHVFSELGLPIGPQGQIQPDNGQQFSPSELGMLAAGLIGGLIGWVDVNFS